MDFTLGYIKSDKQFHMKKFSATGEDFGKIMELEDLKSAPLNGLIYDEENLTEELSNALSEDSKLYPLRSNKEFNLSYDDFTKMELAASNGLFSKMQKGWLMQNNISLLEEMFKVLKHMKGLWPNDRTAFFEELWSLLKMNLAAKELTIIYNDLKVSKKENEKNSLIQVKVTGQTIPNPVEGGEIEEKLMKHYQEEFVHSFQISEYNKEKGELVITATIEKSPVLIMAKVYDLNLLAQTLLKSFFDGLTQIKL